MSPGNTVRVQMMTQESNIRWAYLESLDSSMVELPYQGDRIVMQVLLPRERHGLALKHLEEKLYTWKHNVQTDFEEKSKKTTVNIQLPKFKVENAIPLREHLISLGIQDMFSAGLADFSGIDDSKQLHVSQALQKAFIEVNEEGTEASVATALVAESKGMPAPSVLFIADHPFIFYIRNTFTGMLILQGRVSNPGQ